MRICNFGKCCEFPSLVFRYSLPAAVLRCTYLWIHPHTCQNRDSLSFHSPPVVTPVGAQMARLQLSKDTKAQVCDGGNSVLERSKNTVLPQFRFLSRGGPEWNIVGKSGWPSGCWTRSLGVSSYIATKWCFQYSAWIIDEVTFPDFFPLCFQLPPLSGEIIALSLICPKL